MKAAVVYDFGGPEVLRYTDLPTPEPKPGHVLIKILAAGLNRLEHYIREGAYSRQLPLPLILGSDAAGVVASVGDGVTGFTPGERVIPMPGYPRADADANFQPETAAPSYRVTGVLDQGTYAQYISVPARWVIKDDTGLAPELVATLPMVVATSVRAVRIAGEVGPGQKVLIHAGASGTGSMAIQVARALGAEVAATVRTLAKAPFVRSLGASQVFALDEKLVANVRDWTNGTGPDVVIDNLGGSVLAQSLAAVRRQGIVVSLGFVSGLEVAFNVRDFFFDQKQLRGTLMGSKEDLIWGLEQVKQGRIKPLLDRVFPLSKVADAHRLLADAGMSGNIVLDPWS